MAVFQVDKNFSVILNPEAARLVPELSSLTESELLFVVLAEDYADGPYRKKPAEERYSMAVKRVFKDQGVNLETKRMKLARDAYKSLVFDIRRETLDIYKQKIGVYHREMLSAGLEFKKMKELDQMIQYLEERIQAIETSLEADDIANVRLKGDRQLSYIEIWQKRQQEYRKFKDSQ